MNNIPKDDLNTLPPEVAYEILATPDVGPGPNLPFPFTIEQEAMQELIAKGLTFDSYVNEGDLVGLIKMSVENIIQNAGVIRPLQMLEQIGISFQNENHESSLVFIRDYEKLIRTSGLTIDEIREGVRPTYSLPFAGMISTLTGFYVASLASLASGNATAGMAIGTIAALTSVASDMTKAYNAFYYVLTAQASVGIGRASGFGSEIIFSQTAMSLPYLEMAATRVGLPLQDFKRKSKERSLKTLQIKADKLGKALNPTVEYLVE